MKHCPRCNTDKPYESFGKNKNRKDGRQSYCAECRSSYAKDWYGRADNRATHRVRVRKNHTRRKKELRQKVLEYLQSHPCVDCGNSDIEVLDFDHIDPSTKVDSVGSLLSRSVAWSKIAEEIEKCVIRCANCHRKRTARQFGWYRLVES